MRLRELHYSSLLLSFVIAAVSTLTYADESGTKHLRVCTPDILTKEYQDLNALVLNTLKASNIDFSTQVYPNKRNRMNLIQGVCDLITVANSDTFPVDAPVLKLEPSVLDLSFWLVVSSEQKELCEQTGDELKKYSVVGLKGIQVYERFIYPYFGQKKEATNLKQLHALLSTQRVDFAVLPKKQIETYSQGLNLQTCHDSPFVTLQFHSYLHQSAAWAKDPIESAYREVFRHIETQERTGEN